MNLAKYIDHTNLNPAATAEDIRKLCREAREYGFAAVCVNSSRVKLASSELAGSGVAVCSVVGFPLGAASTEAKVCEARQAVADGADEIDMVINIGLVKDGDFAAVESDVRAVAAAISGKCLKVIIETCLLTDGEKIAACRAAESGGANFVKTSTGFSAGGATARAVRESGDDELSSLAPSARGVFAGATVEDVALMRNAVSPAVKIKASGGIRDAESAIKMIEAGAERIGTSKSVEICSA